MAQRDAKEANAATILNVETVFAVLAGILFLDKSPGLRAMLGCSLMPAGILLSQLKP